MGGRCQGGDGSDGVEDIRVEKEWGGRCQGGDGSNGVEDIRVSDGWKMSGWRRK